MTDQTVPVPIELLKELRAAYRGSSRGVTGTSFDDLETTLEGTAYDRIVALIPTPPKVGDALDPNEVLALPRKSVVIDKDGDPWVVWHDKTAFLAQDGSDTADKYEFAEYQPFILVYLASHRD